MKKTVVLVAFIGISFLAFGKNTLHYTFKDMQQGTAVIFTDYYTGDTLLISNKPSGEVDTRSAQLVYLKINDSSKNIRIIAIDSTAIYFEISSSKYNGYYNLHFTGSQANVKFHALRNDINAIKFATDSLAKLFRDTTYSETQLLKVDTLLKQLDDSVVQLYDQFYASNGNTYFALDYLKFKAMANRSDRDYTLKLLATFDKQFEKLELYRKIKQQLTDTVKIVAGVSKVPNLVLTNTQGEKENLQDLVTKNNTTYVLFWASWCYGCHQLFDKLQANLDTSSSKNTAFIFISFDKQIDVWKREVAKEKILANSYLLPAGFDDIEVFRLNFSFIPYAFKVNKQGIIEQLNVDLFSDKF